MSQHEAGDNSFAAVTRQQKYGTFDDLVDKYRSGEFGEAGSEAWAAMMGKWSVRTGIKLKTGATALLGAYETGSAKEVPTAELPDPAVAVGGEEGLVTELLAELDTYQPE